MNWKFKLKTNVEKQPSKKRCVFFKFIYYTIWWLINVDGVHNCFNILEHIWIPKHKRFSTFLLILNLSSKKITGQKKKTSLHKLWDKITNFKQAKSKCNANENYWILQFQQYFHCQHILCNSYMFGACVWYCVSIELFRFKDWANVANCKCETTDKREKSYTNQRGQWAQQCERKRKMLSSILRDIIQ